MKGKASRWLQSIWTRTAPTRTDFWHQFKPTFDVRFDPQGEFAEFYKVEGMPSSVLIDRHGVKRFTHVGFRPVDGAALRGATARTVGRKIAMYSLGATMT